jgi:hypothetical protein
MTLLEAAQKLLELEKKATPGPWEYCEQNPQQLSNTLYQTAYVKLSPFLRLPAFEVSCADGFQYPTNASFEFIAFSRNHSAQIARALIKAVGALELYADGKPEWSEYAPEVKSPGALARQALKEINGFKG